MRCARGHIQAVLQGNTSSRGYGAGLLHCMPSRVLGSWVGGATRAGLLLEVITRREEIISPGESTTDPRHGTLSRRRIGSKGRVTKRNKVNVPRGPIDPNRLSDGRIRPAQLSTREKAEASPNPWGLEETERT